MTERTTVHLLRHGEVYNPDKILYGRLPEFHLSELGQQMAVLAAEALAGRDLVEVRSSPLERARETAAPISEKFGLTPVIDERIIEAGNVFEGQRVSVGDGVLRQPGLAAPVEPGAPPGVSLTDVAARMRAAVTDARRSACGHETVLVGHQLPVWVSRLDAERRPFMHDPESGSAIWLPLTSFTFDDDELVSIVYTEPAASLYPRSTRGRGVSANGRETVRPGCAPGSLDAGGLLAGGGGPR